MSIDASTIILIAIFLLVAFPVHEFAHAFVAYRLGDGTAKMFGRLTLNPVVHFDPLGGLFLVITALLGIGLLFGWAKPTPVNPSMLRDRRNGEVLVALAGPASNLIMASIAAVVVPGLRYDRHAGIPRWSYELLFSFVFYNVGLGRLQPDPGPAAGRHRTCCSGSCRRSRPGNGVRSFSSTASSSLSWSSWPCLDRSAA